MCKVSLNDRCLEGRQNKREGERGKGWYSANHIIWLWGWHHWSTPTRRWLSGPVMTWLQFSLLPPCLSLTCRCPPTRSSQNTRNTPTPLATTQTTWNVGHDLHLQGRRKPKMTPLSSAPVESEKYTWERLTIRDCDDTVTSRASQLSLQYQALLSTTVFNMTTVATSNRQTDRHGQAQSIQWHSRHRQPSFLSPTSSTPYSTPLSHSQPWWSCTCCCIRRGFWQHKMV